MKSRNALIVMCCWIFIFFVFLIFYRNLYTCIPSLVAVVFFFCSFLYYRRKEKKASHITGGR